MIKSELITCIANKLHQLPEEVIEKAINQILEHISKTLSDGGRVEIRDFGVFSLHYHPARNAQNPKTGKKITTAPKYIPHFKAGKQMRDRINESRLKNIAIIEDKSL